ncbi:MAG TPA: DUF6361 family protein [Pyrinomonadaceae bacterium]
MTSTFAWLDYSEHERRKMLELIEQFREQETRDELGIGSIRDAFADLLFPGTGTVQTRARYFLFVPWMYLGLEAQGAGPGRAEEQARREELALIESLVNAGERKGVIGERARRELKRLPSNIYWLGLGLWGIRRFHGSQDQYHSLLDTNDLGWRAGRKNRRKEDGEPPDDSRPVNWHPGLPQAPPGFPRGTSFTLTRVEAEYLRERILARVPDTMLGYLADRGRETEGVEFPWQHPQRAELPTHLREQLDHGRLFSEAINGAALLYNLMLAETDGRRKLIVHYRKQLRDWGILIEGRQVALAGWDRKRCWEIVASGGAVVKPPTQTFVDRWVDHCLQPRDPAGAADSESMRRLVRERERALKRSQSRLDNRRALELWKGAAGTSRLNYRWPRAEQIIADILRGLRTA